MARKIALVTGVGGRAGIGAGIARKLAVDAWDLALAWWGPQRDDPLSIQRELQSAGAKVLLIESDLERPDSPGNLLKTVNRELGPVSALVLCHCESVDSGILDTTIESFDRHFAVNARASWQLIGELAGQVPESGGAIVALTSDHTVGNMPYGASKGALDRIVIAAARELAQFGITANVINPGPIDTGWMDDATRERVTARQPTGRLGSPEDTANLVSFLLSPAGSWINGQLIKSDGGFSA